MNYEMSQHAATVIAERDIRVSWLERALHQPNRVEPDRHDPELTHHLVIIPEHGDRVLRVVLNNRVAPVRIVTLFFDRKMKGQL
ncbi:MAG TPA: DUF4258 domain-containing protein [Lacunisphaera sp.]|nr:DUF4258 domain-containing protein [Lacunisphaera sp.]